MILENKYVIGCLVMFYEIEMLQEYVDSIKHASKNIDNKKNIIIRLDVSFQTNFETIDYDSMPHRTYVSDTIKSIVSDLKTFGFDVIDVVYDDSVPFHNIAQHRRLLNSTYCDTCDFVIWGETDSLFPIEMFDVIESISKSSVENGVYRYIINFADRKNWDESWDIITHPVFEGVEYVDDVDWLITNEASSKSYMSHDRMCQINDESDSYDIRILTEPKFDGSCLIISTPLILSGVNIPNAVIHCAEDTSFGKMAKRICGDKYTQYLVKNILRVHNRRHPKKRMYILNEDNPRGFVGDKKGKWWDVLEKNSKHNVDLLFESQCDFIRLGDILEDIKHIRHIE